MGDEDHGQPVLRPQFEKIVVQRLTRQLIERGKRLVHQQELRIGGHRACDGNAHLHSTGQRARIGALEAGESDARQRLRRACVGFVASNMLQLQREPHVGEGIRPRHQGWLLKHKAKFGPTAGPFHDAGGRLKQARNHPQHGRFPATARTQQRHEFAFADPERQVGDRLQSALEGFANMGELEDRPFVVHARL